MQLCYWHNKTILLLSMRIREIIVSVFACETVWLCSMLCIIELVLASRTSTTKRTPKNYIFLFLHFRFQFNPQFHVECKRDRMWVRVDWPDVPSYFWACILRKKFSSYNLRNMDILTLVRWSIIFLRTRLLAHLWPDSRLNYRNSTVSSKEYADTKSNYTSEKRTMCLI